MEDQNNIIDADDMDMDMEGEDQNFNEEEPEFDPENDCYHYEECQKLVKSDRCYGRIIMYMDQCPRWRYLDQAEHEVMPPYDAYEIEREFPHF